MSKESPHYIMFHIVNFSFQEMLRDVLGSVVSGRPILRGAFNDCQSANPKNASLLQIDKNIEKFIDWSSKAKVRAPVCQPCIHTDHYYHSSC